MKARGDILYYNAAFAESRKSCNVCFQYVYLFAHIPADPRGSQARWKDWRNEDLKPKTMVKSMLMWKAVFHMKFHFLYIFSGNPKSKDDFIKL